MNENNTPHDSKIEKQTKKSQIYCYIFLFTLGVSSLSGWNAFLSGLSYFADQYYGRNVYFIMPIPNFVGSCLIGLLLPRISYLFSMFFKVVWSLAILCILLILLPIIASEIHSAKGYWFCLITIFLMSLFQSLQSYCCIGISQILGPYYVYIYFVGTGASGIILTLFRIISLASIQSENCSLFLYLLAIYLCIGIAILWNIVAIIMYFQFTNTSQYRKIILTQLKGSKSVSFDYHNNIKVESKNQIQNNKINSDSINSEFTDQIILTQDVDLILNNQLIYQNTQQLSLKRSNAITTLVQINKIAFPIPFLILILYIQTFMMFPGVALQKPFFSEFINWGQTLIILGFNIGDTLGKFLANYRKLFNLPILIGLFLLRFAFFYTYIKIAKGSQNDKLISYFNTFLFGISNGFLTTGYMILGSEKTSEDFVKEKIGFVLGFSLCLGIMLGTFLALPFSNISD